MMDIIDIIMPQEPPVQAKAMRPGMPKPVLKGGRGADVQDVTEAPIAKRAYVHDVPEVRQSQEPQHPPPPPPGPLPPGALARLVPGPPSNPPPWRVDAIVRGEASKVPRRPFVKGDWRCRGVRQPQHALAGLLRWAAWTLSSTAGRIVTAWGAVLQLREFQFATSHSL